MLISPKRGVKWGEGVVLGYADLLKRSMRYVYNGSWKFMLGHAFGCKWIVDGDLDLMLV